MSDISLTELTIEDILTRWPQTAEVFNYYSSTCIGCAIAPFCTVLDAVKYYELPQEEFIKAIHKAINPESSTL